MQSTGEKKAHHRRRSGSRTRFKQGADGVGNLVVRQAVEFLARAPLCTKVVFAALYAFFQQMPEQINLLAVKRFAFPLERRQECRELHQDRECIDEVSARTSDSLDGVHDRHNPAYKRLFTRKNRLGICQPQDETRRVALEHRLILLRVSEEISYGAEALLFLQALIGRRNRCVRQLMHELAYSPPGLSVRQQ